MDSFKQALAPGGAVERSPDGRDPFRDRRERARSPDERGDIPPEIAFLSAHGVAPGLLLHAMRLAERSGTTADAALLGEGLVSAEFYYRALARHLRVPFFGRELTIDAAVDPTRAIVNGIAPLAPNRLNLRAAVAPRGASARYLVGLAAGGHSLAGMAIASPQRLSAAVRAKAGRQVAAAAASLLDGRDPALSARTGLWGRQIACGAALVIGGAALQHFAPGAPQAIGSALLWLIFAAWIALRNVAVAASGGAQAAAPLADEDLPVFSIVAPLKGEATVAGDLVAALDAIDYPRAKLDIKLVIEANDAPTRAAIAALDLPARYDVIVAPPGAPATKPRALNIALPVLRGEFVVVYDAEDEPDPDQLRLAAARFAADPDLGCLQARLVVDNAEESSIATMFAVEYAALFDLVNPGLAALGLPIALGGTSNHFRARTLRRVGGWDAWNVTEDADLGLRLAREGVRVGALWSDTREEAPTTLAAWFRQRVRWQKGWMQTLIVHSRRPLRFARALGPTRTLAATAMIAGSVLGGLFGPALTLEALAHAIFDDAAQAGAGRVAGDVAIYTLLALGLVTILAPALAAGRQRGVAKLARAIALLPLYYALMSAASWAALVDLVVRPFYWAKTEHGRARAARPASRRGAAVACE